MILNLAKYRAPYKIQFVDLKHGFSHQNEGTPPFTRQCSGVQCKDPCILWRASSEDSCIKVLNAVYYDTSWNPTATILQDNQKRIPLSFVNHFFLHGMIPFHLLNMFYFPLLVLQGIYHYSCFFPVDLSKWKFRACGQYFAMSCTGKLGSQRGLRAASLGVQMRWRWHGLACFSLPPPRRFQVVQGSLNDTCCPFETWLFPPK